MDKQSLISSLPIKWIRFLILLVLTVLLSFFSIIQIGSARIDGQPSYLSAGYLDQRMSSITNYSSQLETTTPTPTNTFTSTPTEPASPTNTPTSTLSPTPTITPIVEITETQTEIPLPTTTATITGTIPGWYTLYGPMIANHLWIELIEIQIRDYLICDSLTAPLNIPDDDPKEEGQYFCR
jgi:hypothetical protein